MINELLENDDIYIYDDTEITTEKSTKREFVDEEYINKCLSEIKSEVEKILKDEGYITIDGSKDIPKIGRCHREWEITKILMKERYNIEWRSSQNEYPEIDFD
jgi:hypothetical protein